MRPEFEADSFNNVAAVAVVLLFTKVVSHRLRKVKWRTKATRRLAALHAIAVIAALVAITISLLATHGHPGGHGYHNAAWAFLAIAAIILLVDHLYDELAHAFSRTASGDPSAKLSGAHSDSS